MSEGTPAAETLAVRFANSDSTSALLHRLCSSSLLSLDFLDAHQFKAAFEDAQKINAAAKAATSSSEPAASSGEAGPTEANAKQETDEANAEAAPSDGPVKEPDVAPEAAAKTEEAVAEEKTDA